LLPSPHPTPSEVVQAEDLWQRIVARCPPQHRPILGLRRLGYSLAEISARMDLHPDSIRRILRTLARQLAFEEASAGQKSRLDPTPACAAPMADPWA
jgi:RNA polymerase sigma-70 factor (ECF subfamily)